MDHPLFDASLLPLRQARAAAMGGDFFLHERAFEECLDRIATVRRSFASVLLFGIVREGWVDRLRATGIGTVSVVRSPADPLPDQRPDLCISIGYLDTAADLPMLLATLRQVVAPGGVLSGAFAGGRSLPAVRSAMAAADRVDGIARAHVHPMIDPPSFAGLLANAGFLHSVVDVDRVSLRYDSLDAVVRDLRAMAATNRLVQRARIGPSRQALIAAREEFSRQAVAGRTPERIEILHFLAWAPEVGPTRDMT